MSVQKTLKNLLPGSDVKTLLGTLERIATALEVMAGLRPRVQSSKDESEVMHSTPEEYAQAERDELERGRPVEED